jgi:hypothetical protein
MVRKLVLKTEEGQFHIIHDHALSRFDTHLLVLSPSRRGRRLVDSAINNATSGINRNFGCGCRVWQALYGAMRGVLLTRDVKD